MVVVPQKRKGRCLAPPCNGGTFRRGGANATRFARVPQKRKGRCLAPPCNGGTFRRGGANATRFARVPQKRKGRCLAPPCNGGTFRRGGANATRFARVPQKTGCYRPRNKGRRNAHVVFVSYVPYKALGPARPFGRYRFTLLFLY